jgi:hypothetical protein
MKWAVVLVLLAFSAVALADDARDGWWRRPFRVPVEHPENATVRVPAKDGRPRICSIRRTVDLDVQPKGRRWASDTPDPAYVERVAPLREYELGFARTEGSSRIDAFMRFRFEPPADGRPVRIERPVIYYNGTGYNSEGWTPTGPDAEGFSGARFDIDEFEGIDLWLFVWQLWRIAMIAVALPETGEDRVYWLGHRDDYERPSKADLIACLCAMDPDLVPLSEHVDCTKK